MTCAALSHVFVEEHNRHQQQLMNSNFARFGFKDCRTLP